MPRTLLVRTFLLVSLLIVVTVGAWLTFFGLAEQEPRAKQLAQLTVSVVNLTRAALRSADPINRRALLHELSEREGIRIYPAEAEDVIEALPEAPIYRLMRSEATAQLGEATRFAFAVNGQPGLWTSFALEEVDAEDDDEFWVMLPRERAERDFPWHWLGWAMLSLALALAVAWLIVSRVTRPLRALAAAAAEVGRGRHPAPLAERGSLELQQLAAAFNTMSKDLRRSEDERAEVLAGISHDLRTPLARLRLEAEMSVADAAARDAVVADIEQMDGIIAQFLDYARGDAGEPEEIEDPSRIAAAVGERYLRLGAPLSLDIALLPPIPLRPKALARAIGNLIDNARKYAGSDLELSTRVDGQRLVIELADRDRKSTRLNSSHIQKSRMPSSA